MPVPTDYCVYSETSRTNRNSPLVGSISLDSAPVSVLPNVNLTSLVSTGVDGHTVIIATTSTGQLVKVHSFPRLRRIIMTIETISVIAINCQLFVFVTIVTKVTEVKAFSVAQTTSSSTYSVYMFPWTGQSGYDPLTFFSKRRRGHSHATLKFLFY